MGNVTQRLLLVGAALLVAAQAVAQTSQPLSITPAQFPRWDVDGGWGNPFDVDAAPPGGV